MPTISTSLASAPSSSGSAPPEPGPAEETLASWLLGPADPSTIRERQVALSELRERLDLREDLELIGAEVREGIDPERLANWGRQPPVFTARYPSIIAFVLSGSALLALAGWAFTDVGVLPFLSVILLQVVFGRWQGSRVKNVIDPLQRRTHDLVLLAELLERLERERFECPALTRLRHALETGGEPASKRVARLARLVGLLELQSNQFFTPLALLLFWSNHFAAANRRLASPHRSRDRLMAAGRRRIRGDLRLRRIFLGESGRPISGDRGAGGRAPRRRSSLGHPLITPAASAS